MTKNVHVTKLAAAERQLFCAIRLYFQDEDQLSIHTLASAAFTVLRDIRHSDRDVSSRNRKKSIEVEYLKHVLKPAIINAVVAYRAGQQKPFNIDFFDQYIKSVSQQLPEEIPPPDKIDLIVPEEHAASWWNALNKGANFLKHAERDSQKAMPVAEIHPEMKLNLAVALYWEIKSVGLEPEPAVFTIYQQIMMGREVLPPPGFDDFANILANKSENSRKDVCSKAIVLFNKQLRAHHLNAALQSGGPKIA